MMKTYKIGDIIELQRGYDLTSSQMSGGDVIVAGSNGIIGHHNVERSNHPCITVGRSGSVGKVHYYKTPVWAHNTTLFVRDFKGNCPEYIYYLLKNLHIDSLFAKVSSVIPSLDRKVVHQIEVPFEPSFEKQNRIISILKLLDSKIELNKSINHNLESLAKLIFDYWFVQFDFPDENGRPYKSSGGKMVWNEKLKREIPAQWCDTTLGDICVMYQPKTLSITELKADGKYKVYGANGIIGKYDEYNHCDSEIAMACRGNSCGILNRTTPKSWITGNAMVIKLKIKEISNEYIKQSLYYTNIKGAISGSGQPQITRESLVGLKMILPQFSVLQKFSKIVSPIVDMQLQKIKENDILVQLRNELLPLLMNGQVTVRDDL